MTSGALFRFNALGASNPQTLSYLWDFGDGTAPVKEQVPHHSFAKSGSFDVRVTVNDGRGGSATVVRPSLRVSDVTGTWTGTFNHPLWSESACGPDQFNTGRVTQGEAQNRTNRGVRS